MTTNHIVAAILATGVMQARAINGGTSQQTAADPAIAARLHRECLEALEVEHRKPKSRNALADLAAMYVS